MHFQKFPFGHTKIIHVIEGKILDVIVGIGGEKNKHNVGKVFSHELSKENKLSMYIPDGYAHGFKSLESNTIVVYMQSQIYMPEYDVGLHFNSFGFDWKINSPILSDKDLNLPDFGSHVF